MFELSRRAEIRKNSENAKTMNLFIQKLWKIINNKKVHCLELSKKEGMLSKRSRPNLSNCVD